MPGWTGPPHRSKRWHRKWLQHPLLNRQKAAVFWGRRPSMPTAAPTGGAGRRTVQVRTSAYVRARKMPFRTLSRCASRRNCLVRPDNVTCKDNLGRTRSEPLRPRTPPHQYHPPKN